MSGPWDRPSQDREPLASDQDATPERPGAGETPGEAWPSSDLWSDQRPGAGSGWDDWSTLRAPEDFVLDEPASTLGDPWSESWAAEEAAREIADREAADREAADREAADREAADREDVFASPGADHWAEPPREPDRWPSPAAEPEPVASQDASWVPAGEPEPPAPVPAWEPEREGPETTEREPAAWDAVEPAATAWESADPEPTVVESAAAPESPGWEPEPIADPWGAAASAEPVVPTEAEPGLAPEAPRVAPWQASDDPWAAVVEPDSVASAEPAADEPVSAEPALDEPASVGTAPLEPGSVEEPEPPQVTGGWRRDLLPAWLTGRTAAAADEPESAPQPVSDAVPASDTESVLADDEPAITDAASVSDAASAVPEPDQLVSEAEAEVVEAAPALESAVGYEAAAAMQPVAWEEDRQAAADRIEGEPDPEASAALEADADAAAELEAAPASSSQPWPESDAVTAAAAASALGDADATADEGEEAGDRRFDAWIGGPVIGAAAAAPTPELIDPHGAEEPASAEALADEVGLDAEPEGEAVAFAQADEGLAGGAEPLAEEEAWVAEPEAWDTAPAGAIDAPAAPDAAEQEESQDEPSRSVAAWGAAAAAGAAVRAPLEAEPGPESMSGDSQPTWRPDWLPDVEELEAEERTRVLPTDWTPPPVSVEAVDRGDLEPHATPVRTRPASDVERDLDEEAEPGATTAEQAVPWLIGFILLLAGMVIVLLALIFAGDASLGGGSGAPTPEPSLAGGVIGTPEPSPTPDGSVAPSQTPTPSGASHAPAPSDGDAVGGPQFGPIELVFQGRAAALAPIYLLHREFTTETEPAVLAQDPNLDVRRYAWAMDGTLGAGMYADLMVSIEPGVEKRQLADGISAVTFGPTAETVYAVRITPDGANDVATVLAVDFESGDATELARLTYERPASESRAALSEAQYEDDGGQVRLFWMEDNQLRLWVLNGGMWEIDPQDGEATETARRPPMLWSPDGRQHLIVTEDGATSTLTRVDVDGNEHGSTTVEGLVSHVRWSPESDRIVFTLGRSASGGGVLQDLFLWDLGDEAPTQITATGAAFGAEWMGSRVRWREDPGEA